MDVFLKVKATLLEGQDLSCVTEVDVLGCRDAKVLYVEKVPFSVSDKKKLLDAVFDKVMQLSGLTRREIIGPSQKRANCYARFALVGTLRPKSKRGEFGLFTYKEIGDLLGGRDHTTIIHALRQYRNLRDTKDDVFIKYKELWG